MDDINRKRLAWVAQAKPGEDWPDDLFGQIDGMGCGWGPAVSAMAQAALDALQWRPIAEAPIPGPDGLNEYWAFHCLVQNVRGMVGEGFARYVTDNRTKGKEHVRVLRWYFGDGSRDSRVCPDAKYFMPLPAKRED